MSYNNIDPTDWTYYNPDEHDDYYEEDCSSNNEKQENDKDFKNTKNINEVAQKPIKQKVKNTEKLSGVTKQLSVCKNNIQIRNKSIKILLNMNIDNCISYYAKYEYLAERYVNLAKEKNCLETLIKSFLKTHLHYDLTSPIINDINSLLYKIYNNFNKDIVYNRVKKIQEFIHKKADTKYGCNAYLKLSPKAMRKLLSTSRLHLNIFDTKALEPEVLMSIIEKSTSEQLIHNNTKFTFSGEKAKRDNSKDFIPLIIMDSTLNSSIQKIYNLNLNDEITSYRKKVLSIFDTNSFNY